jgi:hypothetical protein
MKTSDAGRDGGDPQAPGEPNLSAQAAVLVDLARSSLGSMSLQQRSRGLARVNARVARGGGVRVSPPVMAALVLGVAAALVLAGRSLRRSPPSPVLAYAVAGEPAASDGSLSAEGDRRPLVRFSDGTEIQVGAQRDPSSRAHIVAVTEHGARVALDRGELHARVIHWSGSRWLFEAGPFVATVTGTAFSLSWAPDEERFDLRLENGSVAVSGPVSAEPIALRAGQWLTIRLRSREVLIRDIPVHDGKPPVASPAAARAPFPDPMLPDEPAHGAAPPLEPSAPAPQPAGPKRDWAGKLAAGKLDDVVTEAQRWGIDACLAEASSAELSALADAARYTRRGALAKRALLAQRQRFAGSRRAAEAAFLLGRLAEAGEGSAQALSWFERYLSEAPGGGYASEALGREMTLVQQLSGDERAAAIAQEYLRRFPSGTYARAARALLRTP